MIKSGYSQEDLARMGPDELTKRRLLAEALLSDASKQRKIEHPLQGMAQMAEALMGGLRMRRLDQAQASGQSAADKVWSGIFGGGSPAQSSQPSGIPSPGASGEISSTASSGSGNYRDAIASIESAGSGDYGAVGPTHPKLGRALGRYQIMEANIGPWSKAALGREVTPDEFMSNPQLQDAVFDHQFGQYVQRYGPEGAAQAWIGGPGGVGKLGRKDSLGTSVGEYGQKFMNAVGGGRQVASLDTASGIPAGGAGVGLPNPPPQTQMADNAKLGAALTGGGPSQEQLMSIISNPWMSDERKKIAQMLLGQKIEQQNAIRDQQIKQADPAYKLDQEYKRAQLDALRAKPGKNWQKLDDNTLFNPDTGETKAVGTAPGNGGFRFGGNSVEAQSLNGLMDSGQLTPEQAQQLGAGKTITGPNGEIIFMTPQGVFGQPANGGPAQPLSLPEQGNGIDLFDERSPAQPAQQSPAAVSPRAAPSGMIPLTEPKTTVDEKKAMTFADRMATSGAIVDRLGNVGTNTGEVLKSRIPLVGNMIVGEDFQKLDQARRDFINAQLRRESGAVISDAEFDNANKQYFPQPGDSEETIRQKAENRRIAVEGMIRDAGPTYKRPDIQTDEGWTELAPGVRIRKVN